MGWLLPVLGIGAAAVGVWGWAAAERARADQAQLGQSPVDPIGSIFGGGSNEGGIFGSLTGMLPLLLVFMMMKNKGSNSASDDDDVNITIIEDDD
jgi:predicted ABC-type sugar transport system permease subunit